MDIKNNTWAEINLDALKNNYEELVNICNNATPIFVVKANAYGHGAIKVANYLEGLGCKFFAVSSIQEALELRNAGITAKILILGYTPPEYADVLAQNNISQAVYSLDYANSLCQNLSKTPLNIHIKLNTGMNRIGFNAKNNVIEEIILALKLKGLNFEGIFTHFAVADSYKKSNIAFTKKQFELFNKIVQALKENGFEAPYVHCCNSAAAMLQSNMHFTAVRPGIISYGLTPDPTISTGNFKPLLTLKSTVSMVHKLYKGDTVSYGRTFKAKKDMLLATVTTGYADGYSRSLSNKGKVIIAGEYCPIVGRICMDQFMVDVSSLKEVNVGMEVILIGKDGNKEITATDIANICNTINYEVVCAVARRVPRYYFENGKMTDVFNYL